LNTRGSIRKFLPTAGDTRLSMVNGTSTFSCAAPTFPGGNQTNKKNDRKRRGNLRANGFTGPSKASELLSEHTFITRRRLKVASEGMGGN